jgi:hypothetical protein
MSDASSSLHDQMPLPQTGKRKVKKTEKARALEQNTDSDGGHKAKKRKVKKKRIARVKRIPEGESSSEDDQGGDDDVEGKIE